jgi:hypothetical protein
MGSSRLDPAARTSGAEARLLLGVQAFGTPRAAFTGAETNQPKNDWVPTDIVAHAPSIWKVGPISIGRSAAGHGCYKANCRVPRSGLTIISQKIMATAVKAGKPKWNQRWNRR